MIASFALVLALAAPPKPSTADLMKPVHAFETAFNTGQIAFPKDAFTPDATVLDQFTPFVWSGKDSARIWWARLLGAASPQKHARMLSYHEHLAVAQPEFITVTGDRAYFNVPSIFSYVEKGKTHTQSARWVVTEQRFASGWLVVAHAWAVNAER